MWSTLTWIEKTRLDTLSVPIWPISVRYKNFHSSSSNLCVVPQVHHHPHLLILAYTKGICELVAHSPASVVLHVQVVNSNGLTTSRPEHPCRIWGAGDPRWTWGLAILEEPGVLNILIRIWGADLPVASWGLMDTHRITVIEVFA